MLSLCVAARRAAWVKCAHFTGLRPANVLQHTFIGSLVAIALLSAKADAATVQAAPADSFVSFIGVNVHLNWKGTIWEKTAATWRLRLGELGVRYVRSAMAQTPFARDNLNFLFANYGIRANVLIDKRKLDGSLDTSPVKPLLTYLTTNIGAAKIASFEGPNEYSQTKYSGNADWASELRSFQTYLYSAVKSIPAFSSLPVSGPSIWQRLQSDYQHLGNLNASTDLGTLHYYTAGKKPTRYGWKATYDGLTYERPVDQAI
jgi:hypothetical protein